VNGTVRQENHREEPPGGDTRHFLTQFVERPMQLASSRLSSTRGAGETGSGALPDQLSIALPCSNILLLLFFLEYRASGARARRACPFLPTAPGVDSRVLARPRCGVSCAVTRRENNTGHDVPTAAFLIGANVKVKLKASWHGSISPFLFFSPNEERSTK